MIQRPKKRAYRIETVLFLGLMTGVGNIGLSVAWPHRPPLVSLGQLIVSFGLVLAVFLVSFRGT